MAARPIAIIRPMTDGSRHMSEKHTNIVRVAATIDYEMKFPVVSVVSA